MAVDRPLGSDGSGANGVWVRDRFVIPIFLFAIMGAVAISFSPLGRALARRVSGEEAESGDSVALAEVDALREDVLALRHEVSGVRRELEEAQNRIDFTERLLSQARAQGKLLPGGNAR
jgi:hypothetical protein